MIAWARFSRPLRTRLARAQPNRATTQRAREMKIHFHFRARHRRIDP